MEWKLFSTHNERKTVVSEGTCYGYDEEVIRRIEGFVNELVLKFILSTGNTLKYKTGQIFSWTVFDESQFSLEVHDEDLGCFQYNNYRLRVWIRIKPSFEEWYYLPMVTADDWDQLHDYLRNLSIRNPTPQIVKDFDVLLLIYCIQKAWIFMCLS